VQLIVTIFFTLFCILSEWFVKQPFYFNKVFFRLFNISSLGLGMRLLCMTHIVFEASLETLFLSIFGWKKKLIIFFSGIRLRVAFQGCCQDVSFWRSHTVKKYRRKFFKKARSRFSFILVSRLFSFLVRGRGKNSLRGSWKLK